MTFCSLVSALALVGFMHSQDSSAPATPAQPAVKSPTVEEVIQSQLPSYPLSKCPISGEALGSMGDPVNHVVEGRLVRLCCKGCIQGVDKDVQGTLAAIDKGVVEAQGPSYPLKACIVTGESLGEMGPPIDFVHGTRLVRLCCSMCKKGFLREPATYMAEVDFAYVEAQLGSYPLKVCAVCGSTLEGGKTPVDHLYGTRLVRLCGDACVSELRKSPTPVLAKIDAAKKAK